MPGGWIQASPSTCTGTPSSPRIVIFTIRHWGADTGEGWQGVPRNPVQPSFPPSRAFLGPIGRLKPVGSAGLPYLRNAVVLQVDDPRHGHLDAAEDGHDLQLPVVKGGCPKVLKGTGVAAPSGPGLLPAAPPPPHGSPPAKLTLSSLVPPQKLMPPA